MYKYMKKGITMYWSLLMTDTDWIKLPNYLIPLNLFETNFFIQTPSMSSFSWLNKILSLSRSLVEDFPGQMHFHQFRVNFIEQFGQVHLMSGRSRSNLSDALITEQFDLPMREDRGPITLLRTTRSSGHVSYCANIDIIANIWAVCQTWSQSDIQTVPSARDQDSVVIL